MALAVVSALLGFDSESRFVRCAEALLRAWFPYLSDRDGRNKWLRRAGGMVARVVGRLARGRPGWGDDIWLVGSTPVERGRSRRTQRRSDLAGWAQHGWCASRSRFFWGLRLHLIAAPSGLPSALAPAGAAARIPTRIQALTAANWHNQTTHQPGPARPHTAHDH